MDPIAVCVVITINYTQKLVLHTTRTHEELIVFNALYVCVNS